MENGDDVYLSVRLSNERPVAVSDIAESLKALSEEYRSWANEHAEESAVDGVQLYVRDWENGSLIANLVALQPIALPLLENAKSIIAFAKHLHVAADILLGRANGEVPRHTAANFSKIVEPTAKDGGSQINVATVFNGQVVVNFNLSSVESNAIQNGARRELEVQNQSATGDHERVVLYLHQARGEKENSRADRAVIESISPAPTKVIFEPGDAKASMVLGDDNPFRVAWLVDVRVETVRGRPVIYKVTKVHEKLDRPSGTEAA